MPGPIAVNGIDHFALNVLDLQEAADWYGRVFGFNILHQWNTTWMIGRGNAKVGLFLRPNAIPPADIDSLLGIQHVAFAVDADKFATVLQALHDLGLPIDEPEDSGIALSVFLQDPSGNQIEVTTYHA